MEEPKIEQFGITKEILNDKQLRVDKVESRLILYSFPLAAAIGAIGGYLEGQSLVNIIIFTITLSFGGFLIFGIALVGLYHAYLSFFDTTYQKVKKYKDAKAKYDSWWIRTQVEFWKSLSGKRFEQELANLYSRLGYIVSLTPTTGDKGIDLILQKNEKEIIVQCKAHKKPVGPNVARELYGTLMAYKAHQAILASISGFSPGVREFVKSKPIKLICLQDIIYMQKTINDDKGND